MRLRCYRSCVDHGSIPRVCGGTQLQQRDVSASLNNRVYPRVCGGTAESALLPQSPGAGSIPACAGEPSALNLDLEPIKVYPRVCGEPLLDARAITDGPGLSPRVRGNRDRQQPRSRSG